MRLFPRPAQRSMWLLCLLTLLNLIFLNTAVFAQSPGGAMLKLLKSGRVPEKRLPTIVKLICDRGNQEDLQYIFSEVLKDPHWPEELRLETLENLATATTQRKVIPGGDLNGLTGLIASKHPAIQSAAIELAGLWKVKSTVPQLREIAKDANTPAKLRQVALKSLVSLDPDQTRELLKALSGGDDPFASRRQAIAVFAPLDVQASAKLAAELLQQAQPLDDPAPLLAAFLDLKQGSQVLAEQLKALPPEKDTAKLLLRQMYALGRTDAELNQVLSGLAGINQAAPPPTKQEVDLIVAEAAKAGDPHRGEAVFRRKDLSCFNCHAVSKAGGQIGPDLSAVGASSPPDYLATSVLNPDQAIKEAYVSRTIVTIDGKILQGIIADRTKDSLILKDAKGEKITIPLSDIDEEFEGKSLMPKGLVNFMTHAELLDLIAFLSELGKPGDFAIRDTQRMQRYRLLLDAPAGLIDQIPTLASYENLVLLSKNWVPAYARVNGDLPLAELTDQTGTDVVYIRGEVTCSESGAVVLKLDSADGVTLWMDDEELGSNAETTVQLSPGTHAIIMRVDTQLRTSPVINLVLTRPADSAAEYVVVDGR